MGRPTTRARYRWYGNVGCERVSASDGCPTQRYRPFNNVCYTCRTGATKWARLFKVKCLASKRIFLLIKYLTLDIKSRTSSFFRHAFTRTNNKITLCFVFIFRNLMSFVADGGKINFNLCNHLHQLI